MGFCFCLSSGGSTDQSQIYGINDYGQENAVLYSDQHGVPEDFGSVSSLAGGKGLNQDAAILHLVLQFNYYYFFIENINICLSQELICYIFLMNDKNCRDMEQKKERYVECLMGMEKEVIW